MDLVKQRNSRLDDKSFPIDFDRNKFYGFSARNGTEKENREFRFLQSFDRIGFFDLDAEFSARTIFLLALCTFKVRELNPGKLWINRVFF